jgi:hypothetical protein
MSPDDPKRTPDRTWTFAEKVPTIGRKLAMKRLELTKLIGGGNSLSTDAPSGAGTWEIGRLLIVR